MSEGEASNGEGSDGEVVMAWQVMATSTCKRAV